MHREADSSPVLSKIGFTVCQNCHCGSSNVVVPPTFSLAGFTRIGRLIRRAMGGPAATPVGKGRPAPYAAGKGKGSQGKDDGKGKDQDGKGKGSAGRFTRGGKDKGKNTGWRVHEVVDA